jgi:hypothetical protein
MPVLGIKLHTLYLKRVEGEEAPCAEVVSHGQGHHAGTVVQGRHLHLLQRKLNLNDGRSLTN